MTRTEVTVVENCEEMNPAMEEVSAPQSIVSTKRSLEDGSRAKVSSEAKSEGSNARKCKSDKKRQSLARSRRSSHVGLLIGDATEFCELIPVDLPPEKRLHSLLHHCLQAALDKCCSEIADPDVASNMKLAVKPPLEALLNDSSSWAAVTDAVSPSKRRKLQDPNDTELAESLKMTENYIDNLKKESCQWNILVDQHKKDAERADEALGRQDAHPNTCDLEGVTKTGFDLHSWKLAEHHNRLHLQVQTVAKVAASLHSFSDHADLNLSQTFRQLYNATSDALDDADGKKLLKSLLS